MLAEITIYFVVVVLTTSPVVYTHDIKLQLEREKNFNFEKGGEGGGQKLHTCVNRPLLFM